MTLGLFRFQNQSREIVRYGTHTHLPDLTIGKMVDGVLEVTAFNWCGMGKGVADLKPGESVDFYLEPNAYVKLHGKEFCIAITAGTADDKNIRKIWSENLSPPDTSKAPEELYKIGFIKLTFLDDDHR
ncbi:MAG: hypothetical protein QM811_23115 [Pirellulales bacterium]